MTQPVRFIGTLSCAFALFSGGWSKPVREPRTCYSSLSSIFEKSGGTITPELRKAYVQWGEDNVLAQLRAANRFPSDDCLQEVDQDESSRKAIFGAVYPPDPSILQNYEAMRLRMGLPFIKKYRSLALAVSVARRTKGVELVDGTDVGRENQAYNWIDLVLRNPANDDERVLVEHIGSFIKDVKVTALDLYKKEACQRQFIAYLKSHDYSLKLVDSIKEDVVFGQLIMNAMIRIGQRPAARDPKPAAPIWIKHLIDTYESIPQSTPPGMGWPLFPIKSAPWPLLMPLVHSVPIKESDYIWDAYRGLYGQDRFHTYGPYRDDTTAMPDKLLPSKWFWDAFPDRIVHGGECIPISKGTVDLYSTLGKPAMAAAQPGHSNLISFQNDRETWKAEIEQDFCGGPHVTFAQWFFDDDERLELNFRGFYGWSGAEYQVGLAIGMNLGVDSYMDARMASNIYQSMPEAVQKTRGRALLLNALEENPFDPDPWYRLFQISDCDQKFALARAIRARNPAGLIPSARCAALDGFLKSDRAGPVGDDLNAYWGNLEEFAVRNFVVKGDGPHDETTMMQDFQFLQGVPSIGSQDLADFAEKFVGGSRPETMAADVAIDEQLAGKGDPYGRFRMAQRYFAGDGVPHDEAKAREMFVEGAKKGEAVSAILLDRLNPAVTTDGMEVTASSTFSKTEDPKHLIDGTGMVGGTHDNGIPAPSTWSTVENPSLTAPAPGVPGSPAWVKIDFAHPQWFDAIEVWNHNQAKLTDRGFKRLQVYGSPNGSTWYQLTTTAELPQASGDPGEFGTILDHSFSGRALKSVILAAEISDGNYGGLAYGLSAVRFVMHPVKSALSTGQIEVTASTQFSPTQSAQHLLDGSGMTGEYHDNSVTGATMWQTVDPAPMSTPARDLPPSPAWVRFDFSQPRAFDEIMIWNHNQAFLTDRGFRRTRIWGTTNGTDWFPLTSTEVITLPKANGSSSGASVSIANAQPKRMITSVIIAADYKDGNYGSSCFGLSAVRFVSHQ